MNNANMSRDEQQIQEMGRLLRRYATDVFDPDEGELDGVSDEQVDALMRKTIFIRRRWTMPTMFTMRRIAAAAMLMVCCGLFVNIALRDDELPTDRGPIVSSVTRTGKYEVKVCTPHGAIHSRTPDIEITGDANVTYEVSVKNMEGSVVVREIEMNGGMTLLGANCFVKPLEKDEVYSIVVKRNGKTVNDVGNSSFWIED